MKKAFNLGDKVYHISFNITSKLVDCDVCSATGMVSLANERFLCPKCRGQRQNTLYEKRKWVVCPDVLTIALVRSTKALVIPKYRQDDFSYDSDDKCYYEYEYMCKETGTFSGSVYDHKCVFSSKNEAQKECNKRNADERKCNKINTGE